MNICSASFNMLSFQTETAVFCQLNVHCVKNAEKLTNKNDVGYGFSSVSSSSRLFFGRFLYIFMYLFACAFDLTEICMTDMNVKKNVVQNLQCFQSELFSALIHRRRLLSMSKYRRHQRTCVSLFQFQFSPSVSSKHQSHQSR